MHSLIQLCPSPFTSTYIEQSSQFSSSNSLVISPLFSSPCFHDISHCSNYNMVDMLMYFTLPAIPTLVPLHSHLFAFLVCFLLTAGLQHDQMHMYFTLTAIPVSVLYILKLLCFSGLFFAHCLAPVGPDELSLVSDTGSERWTYKRYRRPHASLHVQQNH